jgi:hypothetical protein
MHCNRYRNRPRTRREMLASCANGFGAMALAGLLGDAAYGAEPAPTHALDPLLPKAPHFKARAKSVIFLYMDGGPSQVDTFDPKPLLAKENGQPMKIPTQPTQFGQNGAVMQSPWEFHNYGKCGTPVSDLFPNVGQCVDDMAVIRSVVSDHPEHTNANFFLHTGFGMQGRPSMGAWATYGLGSECRDLPGFIVLNSGMIPPGGVDCFTNGFLPASYQGSLFREGDIPIGNIRRTEPTAAAQQSKLDLMHALDSAGKPHLGSDDRVEAAIANYELAFRMQMAVPDLMDLKNETAATRRMYGMDEPKTQIYGHQCIVARKMVERGVRFVELLCPSTGGDRWDQHGGLKVGHANNAVAVDKPISGLLKDLKSRGLLDTTLVLWAGEFGRTPNSQGDGRDHNPYGFSVWMAGGGIKGGTIYGATDDYGYYAVENRCTIHDLHATILHLMGIDHKRLTYRFSGRDMRLTDVYGEVLHPIIA